MTGSISRKIIDREAQKGVGDMPKGPAHPRGTPNGAPIHKPLRRKQSKAKR